MRPFSPSKIARIRETNVRTPEEWRGLRDRLEASSKDQTNPTHAKWAKGNLAIVKRHMKALDIR